jgi:hypothetical protein
VAQSNATRRGRTWQDPAWRRVLIATESLSDRAQAVFSKLSPATAAPSLEGEHHYARLQAPFTCDGVSAGAPFAIKPEFRGFA